LALNLHGVLGWQQNRGKPTVNEIDDIRRQMAQIRHDLHHNVSNVVSGVSDVVNEVSEVMDWRSILRGHPYILIGIALAAGYLIVPRRESLTVQVPDSFEGAAVSEPMVRTRRFRPFSSTLDLLWPIATQAAQAYAMVWIENRIKQHLRTGPDGHDGDERFASTFERPTPGRLQ
jgi:hypothetical protein